MELEKPFKCPVCNLSFTNYDRLQVHKKRHEMSLNLSRSGQSSSQPDGSCVDETPTPTRFIRNCEEMGLFSELQHVNPFEEAFSKATPTDASFLLDFSSAISAIVPPQRTPNEDTLNTPQVLGFPNSASNLVVSSSKSVLVQPVSSGSTSQKQPEVSASPSNVVSVIKTPSDLAKESRLRIESESSNVHMDHRSGQESAKPLIVGGTPVKRKRTQSGLRLSLGIPSPQDIQKSTSSSSEIAEVIIAKASKRTDQNESLNNSKIGKSVVGENRRECNRASASRARARKNQYVHNLEVRCQTLQSSLAQSDLELNRVRAEFQLFKEKMSACQCGLVPTVPTTDSFQTSPLSSPPVIPPHESGTSASIPISSVLILHPSSSTNLNSQNVVSTSPAILGENPVKAKPQPRKRGRPKKGMQKGPNPLDAIHTTSFAEVSPKVKIFPMKRSQ